MLWDTKNMVAIAICVLFSGLSIVIFGHFDGLLTDSPSIVSLSPLALYWSFWCNALLRFVKMPLCWIKTALFCWGFVVSIACLPSVMQYFYLSGVLMKLYFVLDCWYWSPFPPLWYDHSLLLSSNYTVKERCNMMLTVLICLCWSDSTLFLFIAGYNYPSAKFPCATHDYFPEISTFIPLYPCPCSYVQGTTWCCLNGCGHA